LRFGLSDWMLKYFSIYVYIIRGGKRMKMWTFVELHGQQATLTDGKGLWISDWSNECDYNTLKKV